MRRTFVRGAAALALLIIIATAPSAAFAAPESASATSTRSTGGDKLGAEASISVALETTPQEVRYDESQRAIVKILGRRFEVLGARAKGSIDRSTTPIQTPKGKLDVTIVGVSIPTFLFGTTFNFSQKVITCGADLMVGPVPVYVEFNVSLSISAQQKLPHAVPDPVQVRSVLRTSYGVWGNAIAGVGISWAYVGVRGGFSPLSLMLDVGSTVRHDSATLDASATLGWQYNLALVAQLGKGFFSIGWGYTFLQGGSGFTKDALWPIFHHTLP